ncbi:hypothetical protein SISNIDRAFT_488701 [Sistotremastrum niveocremeum HHB9708]|uniref:Uncharacterized protein n=1 Tax=Sistotremastrum niveocremeum HHB9708 TaxID=1314777 RepID=A0A164R1X1_9AGAM|nr:hypothetical protein SISNIDRAFT_488701 [Sistotremastrum niveocremeum HHB9708]
MSEITEPIEVMVGREDIINMADNPMSDLANLIYWSMLACTTVLVLALLLQLMIMSLDFDLGELFLVPSASLASIAGMMLKAWLGSLKSGCTASKAAAPRRRHTCLTRAICIFAALRPLLNPPSPSRSSEDSAAP